MSSDANGLIGPYYIDGNPLDILSALRNIGRIQIGVRTDHILHERQSSLTEIFLENGQIVLPSEVHMLSVNSASIAAVIYQEQQGKHGKILPRLTLVNGDGTPLLVMVGLDGKPAFRIILDQFSYHEAASLPIYPKELSPVSDQDPAFAALNTALNCGETVEIQIRTQASLSSWKGVIEEIRKGDNFINIIQPGFHLHVRGGVVASWERSIASSYVTYSALGFDGSFLGLCVKIPQSNDENDYA